MDRESFSVTGIGQDWQVSGSFDTITAEAEGRELSFGLSSTIPKGMKEIRNR